MKGDFTRFSHQPHRHYAGVLMQQGRVTLDADWNEQFDIDDHRWRMQTIDTIGRACAPVDNPGFGLTLTPDGTDLIISPGRIYIDGILVEVDDGPEVGVEAAEGQALTIRDLSPHGQTFEPGQWIAVSSDDRPAVVVGQIVSVDAEQAQIELTEDVSVFDGDDGVVVRGLTTYLTQPHFPADEEPPFGDPFEPEDWAGQTHVVYLDVWRRHVTAIEDPHIREVALGGPDTATRVQTLWALRILRADDVPVDAGRIGCADELPAWTALTSPAPGRMSARAAASPDVDDPCAIQPDAGYRGLENRLYRVEIHDAGDLGVATFKWSRDNGSILASIVDFPDVDEVRVHSLGKDQVLRFRADDRVEVLSDESELSGLAGTTASIVGAPDEAERRISLDTDVSIYATHTRPRLRRWDHGADEIPTGSGPIELEDGVQVEFSGGPFRAGDYWVIPARVATGDVEGFIDAPPRGIDHHYARIGLVTWSVDGEESILDCRSTFPSLCASEPGGETCCTVSVGDGGDFDSLQSAVDSLAEIAGPARICILPGEHRLPATVVVDRSDLTISGCGRRSRLVATEGGAMLLRRVRNVRVEDLWIFSDSTEPTVGAVESRGIEVVDCRVVNAGRSGGGASAASGNRSSHGFGRPPEPAATGEAAAEAAPALHGGRSGPSPGPAIGSSETDDCRIRTCSLHGLPAVDLQGEVVVVEHSTMTGGGVRLRDGTENAVIAHNTITEGYGQGVLLGGVHDDGDLVSDRTGLVRIEIVDNRIDFMAREGVSTVFGGDDRLGETEELTVAGNRITRCGFAPIVDGMVLGGGIFLGEATSVAIRGNTITDNGPLEESDELFGIGFGIGVFMCTGLDITDNRVERNGRAMGPGDEGVNLNAGIAALGVFSSVGGFEGPDAVRGPAMTIHGNVITSAEGPGVVAAGLGPMAVDGNEITCSYPGRGLVDVGRAVLLVNFGGPPDLGSVRFGDNRPVEWELRDGRVSFDGNRVTVQGYAYHLPPRNPDLDLATGPVADLATGSAVAITSLDDVLIEANQILNEITPRGEAAGRILSSVWAIATTLRTTTNRITEQAVTARLSYAGSALAHNASDNVTTHCIRVDGVLPPVERDNFELLCLRFERMPAPYLVMIGE